MSKVQQTPKATPSTDSGIASSIDQALAKALQAGKEVPALLRNSLIALATNAQRQQNATPRRDPRTTEFGTPAAHAWNDQWLETVNEHARACGHPICGARTPANNPCPAPPTHENGRCPHHGGFDLTGAPKENRNAVIHGLYARRIQTCGPHCPMFASCPLGQNRPGGPVTSIPEHDRPPCPYEQAEYNAALTDATLRANTTRPGDPLALHLAHDFATLRVMTTRTLAALANSPLIETTEAHSETYHATSTKPATALTAFLRVSSEFRRYLDILEAKRPTRDLPEIQDVLEQAHRQQHDTSTHPDDQAQCHPNTEPVYEAARTAIRHAHHHAAQGDDARMLQTFDLALQLAPNYAAAQHDQLLHAYRPEGKPRPPEVLKDLAKPKWSPPTRASR